MSRTKKDRMAAFGHVWLFERCTVRELDQLEQAATVIDVPAESVLARQGETGREFVVILDGKVEVTRDQIQIATLGSGSFFGEMSLLDHRPRAATVVAVEPCQLLVLTAAGFGLVLKTMPSVNQKMLAVLAERLRDVETKYVPATDRTIVTDLV